MSPAAPAPPPLPRATVDAIAALARLGLTDAEREALRRDLAEVVAFVADIGALRLEDAPPVVGPARTPLREDAPAPPLPRAAALANAADVVGGYFRVPPILE